MGERAISTFSGLGAVLLAAALVACAPSRFVSPRVLDLRVGAQTASPAVSTGGDRWWQVLMHIHSALNFVWVYDDVAQAIAAEKSDAVSRGLDVLSRMRHYRPDVIGRLLDRASRRGADALVLTEHNTLSHARDGRLPARRGRTALFRNATEWTSWRGGGHALLLGVKTSLRPKRSRDASAADFLEAVKRARWQGGISIVAHPTTPGSPWKKGLPPTDGAEVISSWPFSRIGAEALWHDALRQGRRMAAIAGADWHGYESAPMLGAWRITEVRAPVLEESTIYEAIAKGRTVAREAMPRGPQPKLRVLALGRCREGDECVAREGSPVPFVVEVRDGRGLVLEVFDESSTSPADPMLRLPVERAAMRVDFQRAMPKRGFLRAALRGIETAALGSPVYLRGDLPAKGGAKDE